MLSDFVLGASVPRSSPRLLLMLTLLQQSVCTDNFVLHSSCVTAGTATAVPWNPAAK